MEKVVLTDAERLLIRDYLSSKGLPPDIAVTFDDVTLPEEYSDIRSRKEITDFSTDLIAGKVRLAIPIVSANMASVTGLNMAIALEREGGMAFLPQFLPLKERLDILEKLGRADSALIDAPLTVSPEKSLREAKKIMAKFSVHGLVAVDEVGRPVGILSQRDWFYVEDDSATVESLMTKKVISAPKSIDFESAKKILLKNKIEKLPLIDGDGKLAGLITTNGLFYQFYHPRATRDKTGKFLRAGSVGVGYEFTRKRLREVEAQVEKGICVLLIDTARGYGVNMFEAMTAVRKAFPDLPIIAGNVSDPEGVKALFEWGASAVKVGIGPGSVCRTRQVGVGIPQITAIAAAAAIAKQYRGTIIADGGIRNPGDIAKALVAGADAVMLGKLLAQTQESAAPVFLNKDGLPVKNYYGSASFTAQAERVLSGSLDETRRPEGVTEQVSVIGTVSELIQDLLFGLSSNMSYCGKRNLWERKNSGVFVTQTRAGWLEGVKK